MAARRKVAQKRGEREIAELMADFPRQYAALENAMASFGENFDVGLFKHAFKTTGDLDAYNRAQAVERAAGRIQNYIADLAAAGVKLAELPLAQTAPDGSPAQQAFESLREAGVVSGGLCRKLIQAQRARTLIEHSYVGMPAGDVHRSVVLIHETAREFIGRYRDWIEAYVTD